MMCLSARPAVGMQIEHTTDFLGGRADLQTSGYLSSPSGLVYFLLPSVQEARRTSIMALVMFYVGRMNVASRENLAGSQLLFSRPFLEAFMGHVGCKSSWISFACLWPPAPA